MIYSVIRHAPSHHGSVLRVLSDFCSPEYKKGEYNLAYLTIPFLNETTRISEEDQMSRNPDYQGNINTLKTYSSGYNYEALTHAYFCYITDWEYSKNDTIILYLKDGRTLQTSASNVLLVYDPEFD